MDDLFGGFGIEITFPNKEDFLKIKETLTRIGIPARDEADPSKSSLIQSCHILHKKGRYAIFHFKELFAFDGKPSMIVEEDLGRRNKIVELLQDWKLLTVVDKEKIKEPLVEIKKIKVIPHSEKKNWTLVSKYEIGIPKKRKG